MELLRQHLEERPTAERSPTKLGEAVGLSRATIWRQLRQPSTSNEDELELRSQIQTIALEITRFLSGIALGSSCARIVLQFLQIEQPTIIRALDRT